MSKKIIFVTGGVISGLGKGILAASIGALVKARGYSVNMLKIDPYFNFDAGTISPEEHGETFVLADGTECDLDLGNYERFLDQDLDINSTLTSGKIYSSIVKKERNGDFLGKTVQMIPHVTNEIIDAIKRAHKDHEVLIVEIGGTVGDIEGLPYIEAARQIKRSFPVGDILFVHTTLIPFLETSGESKTKPTQHSGMMLRSLGIQPNIIVCRSTKQLKTELIDKISLFCDVDNYHIISLPDLKSIYFVPLYLHNHNFNRILSDFLPGSTPDLKKWIKIEQKINYNGPQIKIAIVGKYKLGDAYLSLQEALIHVCMEESLGLKITLVDPEKLEEGGIHEKLKGFGGIIIPGGFGERGFEGTISAACYARNTNTPFLGICLGLQAAVVEFARNVCGLEEANSTEFVNHTKNPVIDLIEDQNGKQKGGTMRLGDYECALNEKSKIRTFYGSTKITERHRHRYEINRLYTFVLEKNGMMISGIHDKKLVEIVELENHPFFVGTQFHPEFTSRPGDPNPIIHNFIRSCVESLKNKFNEGWVEEK